MPALTIPSPTNTRSASPSRSSQHSGAQDVPRSRSRSQSPDRPPISPLTPTASAAQLAPPPEPTEGQAHILPPPLTTTFKPQPISVPISESENPDAIALRSAISLLQLQREKSKRDLKTLEDLKSAAVSDPEGFVRSLQEQRSRVSKLGVDVLGPTLSGHADSVRNGKQSHDRDQEQEQERNEGASDNGDGRPATQFPSLPTPQNVIRCPPVNWAKYHVVGEPLDKMHEEQKRWPGSTEPPRTGAGTRAPPHAVAAPYSPYTDGVTEPRRTSSTTRDMKKSPS